MSRTKVTTHGRVALESSELRWASFEAEPSSLTVEFLAGGIYRYQGVPETKFQALLTAESHGRYFNANIRNHYPFVRLS